MVAGGLVATGSGGILSSSEVLVHGASSWTTVGSLPMGLSGLRGVSWQNSVFMTGLLMNIYVWDAPFFGSFILDFLMNKIDIRL